jgi:hypothetical protein
MGGEHGEDDKEQGSEGRTGDGKGLHLKKDLNGRRSWGRRQGRRKDRMGKGIHVGERT